MGHLAGLMDAEQRARARPEDRRASIRYRWPRATACCAVVDRTDASWLAHIRDLSAFGIGLLLPRRLDLFTLLEIELKSLSGERERSAQARIVHVAEAAEGEWLLGCALTGELSDADLRRFQAVRSRPAAGDQRRWTRCPCNVETACSTSLASLGEQIPTRVVDISAGGIGLVVPCELEAGTLLNFELPPSPTEPAKKVLIRVLRVREMNGGDWLVGCEVADCLTQEELDALR